MKKKTLLSETQNMLTNIVGEETAAEIFKNMFPKPIKGYVKGRVLTVGELKKLPENSIVHLWYEDEDEQLRNDDFVVLGGYDGGDEICTKGGFSMPIDEHNDDELVEFFDNCGWAFTVREAIKKGV